MEVFLLLTCFKGVWHTGGTKGTVLALFFQKAGRVSKPRKIQNLSKNCGSADPLKNSSDLQDGLKTLIGAEYSGGSECYRASFRNGFSSVPSRQLGCINFFFLTPLQSDSN